MNRLGARVWLIILCGALVMSMSMGVRQSFGLFLEPMSHTLGWKMSVFALALAVQNLIWGLASPFAGAIADRYGTLRTLIGGTAIYVIGVVMMAYETDPQWWGFGAGILVGMGVAGTGFPVVLGAVARAVPVEKRSSALGIAAAGGSFGQFTVTPASQGLIDSVGWIEAMVFLAAMAGLMAVFAVPLRGKPAPLSSHEPDQSLGEALGEAFAHNGYRLLVAGFFVCGFHIAFVAVHFPKFLATCELPAMLGATTLSLIGFFNIIGTYGAGQLGQKHRLKYLLAGIYFLRAVTFGLFFIVPVTETSVLVFGAALGLLWLSTVPLTSGLVAQIFGQRYMTTLYSIVFLSHQIGAFFGAWLAGVMFDRSGNYDFGWLASVALGLFAAAVHMPIADRPVLRAARAAA